MTTISRATTGTHVAGIATANRYVENADGTYTYADNGVVGVAPDAQVVVMKVFGKNGGAYADDYIAAIEDAIVLDCDSVNLSLGSRGGRLHDPRRGVLRQCHGFSGRDGYRRLHVCR